MKIHDIEQNTDEWYKIRAGKFTASSFADIFATKTTTQYEKAIYKVVFERVTGKTPETFSSAYMERGHELEPEAIDEYERTKFVDVDRVGFVELNEWIGCSPDGMVDEHGLVEIKCPAFNTMINCLRKPERLISKYKWQIHGQMYVTGRLWCDIVAYHPDLGIIIQRVERDESLINELKTKLAESIEAVKSIIKEINK